MSWNPFRKSSDRRPLFSDQDKHNLRWFWDNYLKSKTPWLFLVLGMVMVQGLVYQQFISLTETGLRVIFENGDISGLVRVCFMVFGIFALRALMSFLVPRVSVWLASDAVLRMRQDLIDHMMILDLAYFEKTSSGDIILRLVNQAHDLSDFVGQTTVSAVRDVATVVIVSGYLIWKSPLLFLSAVVVMPFVPLTVRYVSNKIKHIQRSAWR